MGEPQIFENISRLTGFDLKKVSNLFSRRENGFISLEFRGNFERKFREITKITEFTSEFSDEHDLEFLNYIFQGVIELTRKESDNVIRDIEIWRTIMLALKNQRNKLCAKIAGKYQVARFTVQIVLTRIIQRGVRVAETKRVSIKLSKKGKKSS